MASDWALTVEPAMKIKSASAMRYWILAVSTLETPISTLIITLITATWNKVWNTFTIQEKFCHGTVYSS